MEITFFPSNKHLLLEPVVQKKEEKKKSNILLPEELQQGEPVQQFGVYKVKKVALDCLQKGLKDKVVVVEGHMVLKLEVDNVIHYLIHENHVLGFFMEE